MQTNYVKKTTPGNEIAYEPWTSRLNKCLGDQLMNKSVIIGMQ